MKEFEFDNLYPCMANTGSGNNQEIVIRAMGGNTAIVTNRD